MGRRRRRALKGAAEDAGKGRATPRQKDIVRARALRRLIESPESTEGMRAQARRLLAELDVPEPPKPARPAVVGAIKYDPLRGRRSGYPAGDTDVEDLPPPPDDNGVGVDEEAEVRARAKKAGLWVPEEKVVEA
jgi:hypothetical protein